MNKQILGPVIFIFSATIAISVIVSVAKAMDKINITLTDHSNISPQSSGGTIISTSSQAIKTATPTNPTTPTSKTTTVKTPVVTKPVTPTPTVTTPAPTVVKSGYTLAEVSKHSSASSCWTAVNGAVYDVTSFINEHPGGSEAILSLCGRDGSSAFNDQHGGQRRPARELANYKIGDLNQ